MDNVVPWEERHAQLSDLSQLPVVVEAHKEAWHAASLLPQTDDNAANTSASHNYTTKIVNVNDESERLGKWLDVSLAIFWSSQKGTSETNVARLRAMNSLRAIASASICDSNRDFVSLACLESNREGTVELVRCRFDKQIYVLKSMTKGAARRGFRSNAPMTERRLLSLAHQATKGVKKFTPSCVAAFQSQASLHILMEYCPAGDLYHFLESAGQAPPTHEARNSTGGLLSESYVRSYAIDIVAAVSWLHEQGFMHRDIKPGNWLFDRSGHLLLCDLASAAPFSLFNEVPASASLPDESGARMSKRYQRRVLYRHCCLIGTADYIAPEIFWSADLISRRRQRQHESYCSGDSSMQTTEERSEDGGEDDDEPPPEGPGLYGPECDWWSVGVLLYEMAYKQLPFFSEKVADTMEMIKHHQDFFTIDDRIRFSAALVDLLRKLITDAEQRIGKDSSSKVQHHPFFHGVDWSEPWRAPPPFLPQVDTAQHETDSASQPELSVLHSPCARMESQSFNAGPANWSKIWSADADDFPAFPNSVEHSRVAIQLNSSASRETGSTDTLVDTASTSSGQIQAEHGSALSQWSRFDPTWIGFSFVPHQHAFSPAPPAPEAHLSLDLLSSPVALVDSSLSREQQGMSLSPRQLTSTPPSHLKSGSAQDTNRSALGSRASLHRNAVQAASRMRNVAPYDGRFVTPMRKTSSNNVRLAGNDIRETPAAAPASPYPFPIATSARRPSKTPATEKRLRRNDLDRARSASAETGEGSDSRCSGGSNAKRDISEREAWLELKRAVSQSARKGGPKVALRSEADEDRSSAEGAVGATSADESHIPVHVRRKTGGNNSARKIVTFDADPTVRPGNTQSSKLGRLLSDNRTSRKPLEPILDTTPPHHSGDLSPASSASSSPVSPRTAAFRTYNSDSGTDGQTLTKKKSARQLLLTAQHRETPTKIARTASPMLIEPLSTLTITGEPDAIRGRDSANLRHPRAASADTQERPSPANLEAPLPSAVAQLKRMNSHLMRRRDSHETLSQYRQGINPDEPGRSILADGQTRSPNAGGNAIRPTSLVIPPTNPMTLRADGALSSPSLPSFPDAFVDNDGTAYKADNNGVIDPTSAVTKLATPIAQKPGALPQRRSMLPLGQRQDNQVNVADAPPLSKLSPTVNAEQVLKGSADGVDRQQGARAIAKDQHRPSLVKRASSYLSGNGVDRHIADVSGEAKHVTQLQERESRRGEGAPVPTANYAGVSTLAHDMTSVMGSLAWRYDRLQAHINQVEGHLERIKARLQHDY